MAVFNPTKEAVDGALNTSLNRRAALSGRVHDTYHSRHDASAGFAGHYGPINKEAKSLLCKPINKIHLNEAHIQSTHTLICRFKNLYKKKNDGDADC